MTWFQVDDGLPSHAKVVAIPRSIRAEAIGTWTLCGAWSADKLTDGKVPAYMVEEVGGTIEGAAALVEAKLWRKTRAGYVFANWGEYQRTREDVLTRREEERNRKAKQRARRAGTTGDVPAGVPVGQTRRPNTLSSSSPTHDDDQDLTAHPHVTQGSAEDDLSPDVKAVVDNVAAYCGRTLHPLAAADVIQWLNDRRGPKAKPLRSPVKFYASAIANSAAEVQQFIDEEGIAS